MGKKLGVVAKTRKERKEKINYAGSKNTYRS
jgi:hypothetical protein